MPLHLPPSRPGTPSAHSGARILRTRSEPTDFLNQKVGKYGVLTTVTHYAAELYFSFIWSWNC